VLAALEEARDGSVRAAVEVVEAALHVVQARAQVDGGEA